MKRRAEFIIATDQSLTSVNQFRFENADKVLPAADFRYFSSSLPTSNPDDVRHELISMVRCPFKPIFFRWVYGRIVVK